MLRILEHPTGIPRPISMILAYPALDFNFTSWMSPANLRVLRTEQSEIQIPGLVHGKDHMRHKSPLSVVDDVDVRLRKNTSGRVRQKSWGEALASKVPKMVLTSSDEGVPGGSKSQPISPVVGWTKALPRTMSAKLAGWLGGEDEKEGEGGDEAGTDVSESGSEDEDGERRVRGPDFRREADKSLRERVKTPKEERKFDLPLPTDSPRLVEGVALPGEKTVVKKRKKAPIGTRLTMTSRVGYFQDRIISPSMVSAIDLI
jgi:hypothetical protein